MNFSFSIKKLVSSYMLVLILFMGYNMLQLPKAPYYAIRFLLMFIVAVYTIRIAVKNFASSSGTRLFVFYFLYLVFSFIWILIDGLPHSLILDALMSGLFPMLFFFVGSTEKDIPTLDAPFYKFYFWGCVFLFICSIYLFVTMPFWYLDWKITGAPEGYEENVKYLSAMSGFSVTGYLVGYSSLFAFCYLLFKFKSKKSKAYDIALLFIVVFCLVFAQARVAILMAVIVLLWYILTTLNVKTILVVFAIVIPAIFILINIVSNNELLSSVFEIFTSKVEGASGDTRYESGLLLLSQQTNFIFGHGYGSGGHKADTLGLPSVTDFEYVKIFYETGIIGFVLFLAIIFKAIAKKPRISLESFIIIFYLLAMLIANPLTADATMSPVFWYAVGRRLT